ncbi:MAG: single-stranded DNA-binding protein [Bacilli bacterium]|nr:single-stranded DNA-binding protein [Bacilli bacterium]
MNRVILIGRLARDPEMRTTPSGVSMTRFTIAVSRPLSQANREAGNQAQTDFISCIAWRRQAENIAKYCSKGSQVAVEGRIQTGQYDGADGQRHYTTDVYADNVTFLGSRGNASNSSSNDYSQPMPNYDETMPTTDVSTDPFKDFGEEIALSDDDLPF